MRAMSRLVLALALRQAKSWQADGPQLSIAVNLSASSLVDDGLPEEVFAMLAAQGSPCLCPTAGDHRGLPDGRSRPRRKILTTLRTGGVQISIDDYGTGYSSLSYLRDLPVDELKLDQSFVFPMTDDGRAAALVASSITLAHSLGLRMVAEGVETETVYAELAWAAAGAQGYLISKPLPAQQFDQWLRNRALISQTTSATPKVPSVVPG